MRFNRKKLERSLKERKFRYINLDLQTLNFWAGKLNPTHCFLFAYILRICESKSDKVNKQRRNSFTWVDYRTLLDAIPLIGIKKRALVYYLDTMAKEGLLVKSTEWYSNKKYRTYFKISSLYWDIKDFYDGINNGR